VDFKPAITFGEFCANAETNRAIEKRVAAAAALADKLSQPISAKTVRDELVPTEAD